mmetsp:Transcript_49909/g.132638  ORF Transcript_49909/g.132638 Transcript_49909/m.132638 type:complete len:222 (+) Transcript_49909:949-1614(+)
MARRTLCGKSRTSSLVRGLSRRALFKLRILDLLLLSFRHQRGRDPSVRLLRQKFGLCCLTEASSRSPRSRKRRALWCVRTDLTCWRSLGPLLPRLTSLRSPSTSRPQRGTRTRVRTPNGAMRPTLPWMLSKSPLTAHMSVRALLPPPSKRRSPCRRVVMFLSIFSVFHTATLMKNGSNLLICEIWLRTLQSPSQMFFCGLSKNPVGSWALVGHCTEGQHVF